MQAKVVLAVLGVAVVSGCANGFGSMGQSNASVGSSSTAMGTGSRAPAGWQDVGRDRSVVAGRASAGNTEGAEYPRGYMGPNGITPDDRATNIMKGE